MMEERTEREFNDILNRARKSLTALSLENPVESFVTLDERESVLSDTVSMISSSEQMAPKSVSLDLELGRTVLTVAEVARLGIHSIIPLPGRNPDSIQLYCGDSLVAEGTLLVTDGKLTVRIEHVFQLIDI